MRFHFWTIRFYPYWALAVAMILFEVGYFFKVRRQRFLPAFFCWLFGAALLTGVGFWIYYRGDLFAEKWIRELKF